MPVTPIKTAGGMAFDYESVTLGLSRNISDYENYVDFWIKTIPEVEAELPEGFTYSDWFERGRKNTPYTDGMEVRRYFIPLAQRIVRDIFRGFASGAESVLEIGSGVLDNDGNSYLGKLLPKETNLTYSDLPPVVETERVKTERTYDVLDIRNMNSPEERYDVVSGINVLDVIRPADLTAAVTGAYQMLKERGAFIVLADRNIDHDIFASENDDPNLFVIPWIPDESESGKGIRVFKKEDLEKNLDKKKIPLKCKLFFKSLLKLTPQQRYLFFSFAFHHKTPLSRFCNLFLLQNCTPIKEYLSQDKFSNSVASAMQEAGFEVRMNETRSSSQFGPRGNARFNACVNYEGSLRQGNSTEVPAGKIYYETQFLAIVGIKV